MACRNNAAHLPNFSLQVRESELCAWPFYSIISHERQPAWRIIVLESHSCIDCVSNFFGDSKWLALMRANSLVMGLGVEVEVEHRVSRHAAVPELQPQLDSVPWQNALIRTFEGHGTTQLKILRRVRVMGSSSEPTKEVELCEWFPFLLFLVKAVLSVAPERSTLTCSYEVRQLSGKVTCVRDGIFPVPGLINNKARFMRPITDCSIRET